MNTKKRKSQEFGSFPQNTRRTFSEELKRKKVYEIELGIITMAEVSRAFQVSRSAIYKWKEKYSVHYKKQEKIIMESKSETKKVIILQKELAEIQRLYGQKQIEIDLLEEMIKLVNEQYGIDVKKTFTKKPC